MDLTSMLILLALSAILFYACVMNAGADEPATAGAHGHDHADDHAAGHGGPIHGDEHQGEPGAVAHPREH